MLFELNSVFYGRQDLNSSIEAQSKALINNESNTVKS